MICSRCGNSVPEGQLVCGCFAARADLELRERSLERWAAGQQPIYLTGANHLLPTSKQGLTLCGKKRYKAATTQPFWPHQIQAIRSPHGFCQECVTMASAVLTK
jgi:hypothetical protein